MAKHLLLGVDEAGRGPLAGPVAVGVVAVATGFNFKKYFPDARDSKVLSEKKREDIYTRMQMLQQQGLIDCTVVLSSAKIIDTIGITTAVHKAIYKGIYALAPNSKNVKVLLDGLLHAPPEYKQKTIIRGDATEAVISLASIAAKVTRDRLMKKEAKKYPTYGFEVHKGYGTKKHREAIQKEGLCPIHRTTYCH